MRSQQIQQRSVFFLNTPFECWKSELKLWHDVFVFTVHTAHEPYEATPCHFGLQASFNTFQTILSGNFEPYAGHCRRVIRGVDIGLWHGFDIGWYGLTRFVVFVLFVLISLPNFSVWIQVHSKTSLRKIAERECNWSEGTRHLKTPHLTAGTHTHTW
jgi:hypothetical protein